jgi:hypothetical protein
MAISFHMMVRRYAAPDGSRISSRPHEIASKVDQNIASPDVSHPLLNGAYASDDLREITHALGTQNVA